MRKLILITSFIFSMGASAELLPQGSNGFRVDVGYSTAPGLWKGETFSNFAGDGNTTDYALALTSYFGLSSDMQIDLSIQFRHREYSDGDPEVGGTINAGDSFDTIPEVGFRLNKQFAKEARYDIVGFFGVRAPGDDKRTGNFLDGSDGITKYDLGTTITNKWSDLFSTSLTVMYTHRPGEHADQITANGSVPFYVSNWAVGPMLTYQTTFDGTDIGDSDFTDSTKSTFRNFSLTKEEYFLIGVFGGTSIAQYMTLDFNIHRKVGGRNTDKATGIGAGVSYYY